VVIEEFGEILQELVGSQVVDAAIEIVADTSDSSGVGLDGLGLEAAEFQTFLVLAVKPGEAGLLGHGCVHGNLLLWEWVEMAIGHALPFLSEQKERLQSDNEERVWLSGVCLPRSGFVQQNTSADGVNGGGATRQVYWRRPLIISVSAQIGRYVHSNI